MFFRFPQPPPQAEWKRSLSSPGNGCPDRRASCRGAPELVELLVGRAELRCFAPKIAFTIRWKRKAHVVIEGVFLPAGRNPSAAQDYRRRREVAGGVRDRVVEFLPLELESCRVIRQINQ